MEESKFLTSFHAMPAAQVFGRVPRLFFSMQPITIERLEAAMKIDPVVFGTLDVNGSGGVLTYLVSNLEAPDELISTLGPVDQGLTPLFPYPRRRLSKPVSLPEMKVLRVLVKDLRTPLKQISGSTGLSQKLAKRIRRQLLEQGLIQVQPIFQSARSSRILMYELHIHSDDDSVLSRVGRTLPRSMFVNQWEGVAVILSCWADSISEVFDTQRALSKEPGVTYVRTKFHARTILSTDRLTSWIDQEIQAREERKGLKAD